MPCLYCVQISTGTKTRGCQKPLLSVIALSKSQLWCSLPFVPYVAYTILRNSNFGRSWRWRSSLGSCPLEQSGVRS
ncbi:hypothetical protein CKAH01_01196 [Colletotrichum kahawae]|uniref:Uncharacterized protein n=1 Tax=Colletotrichum kahawae TaxID=34407 RepID=A0AAE0D584_COLKA|nr:hypothetical protein CKAH01_01196 [Colletotrichum kahawae]